MDRLALLVNVILMHNENDGTMLGYGMSTDGTDIDLSQLVVVNTRNVHMTARCRDDTDVIAGYSAIGATIDESTVHMGRAMD